MQKPETLFLFVRSVVFRCQQCGEQSAPHEKQSKKILSKRPKVYKNGGIGWEIKKEISVCGKCS